VNERLMNAVGRLAARVAIVIASVHFAFAVGAPWMLNGAPPSPQDVTAAQVCCARLAGGADARPARP